MKINQCLKAGIKIRRWILLVLLGVMLLLVAISELVNNSYYDFYHKVYIMLLIISGIFIIYISIVEIRRSFIVLENTEYTKLDFDSKKIESLIYEKRLLVKGPKIVVIGGGTGLSTMLRGLKYYTSNITAIVTVGDNGGGSGVLREDLGMLPPGDIRNCILALADTEPLMEELLQYRFKDGRLKDQNFGNLFLAAMDGISENFEDAVQKMSSVLAVTGKVLPVTLEDMQLIAVLEDGEKVYGESEIPEEAIRRKSKIKELMINPQIAYPLKESLEAIKEADAIILGPGSLYTSVISNLLVQKIASTVRKSSAIKIYVSNIMTQPGETDGFTVSDHINILRKYGGKDIVDYVITNSGEVPNSILERYLKEGSELVKLDKDKLKDLNVQCIKADLVKIDEGYVKHNTEKLSEVLIDTIMKKKLLYDKKKIIEYMYLSQRIRQREREEKKSIK